VLFGSALLVWLPVYYLLFKKALAEIDASWDAHLAQSASALLALASANAERNDMEVLTGLLPSLVPAYLPQSPSLREAVGLDPDDIMRSFAFQLHSRDGSFQFRSPSAPEEPFPDQEPGFSNRMIDGTAWRVFTLIDPKHALLLHIAEDRAARKELAWHLIEHLLLPTLFVVPPLVVLFWLAVGRWHKNLNIINKKIIERDPDDLSPLLLAKVPSEIKSLVTTLNRLFSRLKQVLDSERSFTGSAAHELRTPLAALRIQAQVALKSPNEERRQHALIQVIACVDQTAHLIDQLLTMARLDTREAPLTVEAVDLGDMARHTADALTPLAKQHQVSLQVVGTDKILSPGDATCLGILMRNLIDNGIRHTGPGGSVKVTARTLGRCNQVLVTDSGPGIPAGQHEAMFRRFRRGDHTTVPGSGLGLSIVRRICELHGGRVRLNNRKEGGLCCEVLLPSLAAKDGESS